MSADYNSLYNAAIKMLAAREHCAAELRVKLLRRSADKVLIESVVAALQEASYLDDERFAEVFAGLSKKISRARHGSC